MVRVSAQLAVAASIASLVSAAPTAPKTVVIPVKKGSSGKSITSKDVVEHDLARIAAYNDKSGSLSARASSGPAINEDVSYIAEVSICGTVYDLIIDTGSSNTWVRLLAKLFAGFSLLTITIFSTGWSRVKDPIDVRYEHWPRVLCVLWIWHSLGHREDWFSTF